MLLCALAVTSCEKNAVTDITAPFPGANIKFFNFEVNAPGVNFYSNDAKVTAANKTVDAFVVEDPFPAAIDFSVATVRFVNAIAESSPAPLSVRNQATGTVTPIGAAVACKSAGTFTTIPAGVYDLAVVFPGAVIASRTSVTFNPGRTYTIGARGDITASTGTTVPTLDNTANR